MRRLGGKALGLILCVVGAYVTIRGVLIGVAGFTITTPLNAAGLLVGGVLLGALFLVPGVKLLRTRRPR